MGEEAKQVGFWQEQAPVEAQPEENKAADEQKKEPSAPAPPPPPPHLPFVLLVDLHCVGCAKKIERSIMNIRVVEGVVIDMAQNQVMVKGIIEPQAIYAKIMKKTK